AGGARARPGPPRHADERPRRQAGLSARRPRRARRGAAARALCPASRRHAARRGHPPALAAPRLRRADAQHVQRVRARRLAAGAAVRPRRARGRRGAGEDARVSARPRPARRGPRGDRGGPDGMRPAPDPLLLALLRGDEAASATAEDWRRAATAARAEGLEPWLFRRVVRSASAAPDDVREALREAAAGVAARALALETELAAILRALAAAGIACAPLRGAALAERLYDHASARPAGDIDLLVRKTDLDAVEATLAALGFSAIDRRPGFAREFSYTLELARDAHGGVVVEPHWTLAYPPFADALDMERVWARCRRGRVVGEPALLLAPEATLLNLCLHLVHKAPDVPLLWRLDFHRLVRLFALPGLRRRARYAAALLFPSPRFMAVEYGVTGRGGLALAYGRRARHVLWEGVKGTARLLRLI